MNPTLSTVASLAITSATIHALTGRVVPVIDCPAVEALARIGREVYGHSFARSLDCAARGCGFRLGQLPG